MNPEPFCSYMVFDLSTNGEIRKVAEVDASSYQQALRQARRLLPDGPGELRQGGRVICRFGRSKPAFMQR